MCNRATVFKFLLKTPTTKMTTPKHTGIAGANLLDTCITPVQRDRAACKLPEIPSYVTPFHHTWGFLPFASKVTSTSMHMNLVNI